MSLNATQHYLRQGLKILQISDRLEEMLVNPYRVVKTKINIELDSGSIGNYIGYRIQHNNTLGPMKGGLRYHPTVDEQDVESLASLMTWKTSLLQLPFGGAKGGIQCDPSVLTLAELERLTKAFTVKIKDIIGPYKDIPAPDVNTNAQTMAWIMSEYSKHYGFSPAVVTGKPVFLHGSAGREYATGLGVVLVTKFLLAAQQQEFAGQTFIVQGFGNVGYYTAKFIENSGGKVIGISDASGAILDEQGIDVDKLYQHTRATGVIHGYDTSKAISHYDLLVSACDVLIPAALGNVFDADLAEKVNCRYIIEAANSPTLPDADIVFNSRGIIVAPDILANAGGVVASYFEWAQNIQQTNWNVDKVDQMLHDKMRSAFDRVQAVSQSKKCSLRVAAYYLGLGRVAKARLTLGI